MKDNPFSPSFGISPPVLAGRQPMIDAFRSALQGGIGSPGRATLYLGGRGSGKTVLLNEIEDVAAQEGWITVSETAAPGIITRLVEHRLPAAAREVSGSDGPSVRLRSISGFGFGVGLHHPAPEQSEGDVRSMMEALAAELAERGNGLLLTVDEIQGAVRDELAELAVGIQHLLRQRAAIAVAFGGLPGVVKDRLLNDSVLTFLRRAERHTLGTVKAFEAYDVLEETARIGGKGFEPDALRLAADASAGYPFMIQLIGYHAWKASGERATISVGDIDTSVPAAQERLGALVLEPALGDLSPNDRRFLLAMSVDDGPSKIGELAGRLGTSSNQASQYRLRLLDTQMIDSPSRGLVNIAMPYLRQYLRTNGALGETLD
jgi:hypothetical protein